MDWTVQHLVPVVSACFLVCVIYNVPSAVNGQAAMDPKVNITSTDPPSDGAKIRGTIAKDVVMNCHCENVPSSLSVRWQRSLYDKNGRETTQIISQDMAVADNTKWSIEKPTLETWRLRIKYLHVDDEGNYTCYVRLTGNNNRVESNRTVLSTSPPEIIEMLSSSNTQVKEGDFVPLRCNASGRPVPTLMWRRQGNAIFPPPDGGVRRMGPILDIPDVQYDARGKYICEAFNEVGTIRRDMILTVQFSPKVSPDSDRVGQAVGYRRTLVCYIEANPMPSLDSESNQLYWLKGSQRVLASGRFETRAIVGAHSKITYELIIHTVQKEDFDTWKCASVTNLGRGETAIELFETDTPQPDKREEISGVSVKLSSIVTLLCALLLTYLWA